MLAEAGTAWDYFVKQKHPDEIENIFIEQKFGETQ